MRIRNDTTLSNYTQQGLRTKHVIDETLAERYEKPLGKRGKTPPCCESGSSSRSSIFSLETISKIPVVIKGRALAYLSKKKKSKNPQNSSLFLWFFDSFIFKICTKFAALLTNGVFETASWENPQYIAVDTFAVRPD
jgi:hypothetical protein